MPYTLNEEKTYPVSLDKLKVAALGAISGLEGSVSKQEADGKTLMAKFPKTILNNLLGDRTEMELTFDTVSDSESKMRITIYPINPVGQKLLFGARKGVTKTVLTWFIAHTEHRLK